MSTAVRTELNVFTPLDRGFFLNYFLLWFLLVWYGTFQRYMYKQVKEILSRLRRTCEMIQVSQSAMISDFLVKEFAKTCFYRIM